MGRLAGQSELTAARERRLNYGEAVQRGAPRHTAALFGWSSLTSVGDSEDDRPIFW